MNLRRRLNIKADEQVLVLSDYSPGANFQIPPIKYINTLRKQNNE